MGLRLSWALALLSACATPAAPPSAPAPSARVSPTPAPREISAPLIASVHAAEPAEPELPPEPALTLELPAIDRLLADAIAEGKLPGAVITVGSSRGTLFQRAYGQRSLVPAREPMTTDTVFDLASLTKSVATATAAMWLVEHGQLALDARVSRYLPEVVPTARAITVRQLLLHTSGLPAVVPLSELAHGPERARQRLLKTEPQHPPGTRYQYSDVGFIWLGALLERAAGESLDTLVARVVLEPLSMHDSRYVPLSATPPDAAWLARVAPTELTEARPIALIHGEVHDPRAYRLGGVAGNAGLFSTARDLSRFARMLLGGGALLEQDGRTAAVLNASTVATLTEPRYARGPMRALGWDVRSGHSRNRGTLLSPRAFGHGGHTGTALWIDPDQDLFVLFLSNRVHPSGDGDVIELTGRVMDAAVLGLRAGACPSPDESVRPGIDVLRDERFARLAGKRVGLLTHRAARGSDGITTLEAFARASELTLAAVFTPEHGLDADAEGAIGSAAYEGAPVPVHSLFGKRNKADYSEGRRPTEAMLRGLDLIAIDLVDVGTRFYTYASTVREVLIAASQARLPVLILDRPNPIGADRVEGPPLDPGIRSFVNHHPLPVRHGLTLGELATLMARDLGLRVQLDVVRVAGYHRGVSWADTRLEWHPPSPNLIEPSSALLYPAVGVLEGTNLSVGRGTERPFEQLGAPYVDAERLAAAVEAAAPPGVAVRATRFTPSAGPFAGQTCSGVLLSIDDPRTYSSARTGMALIRGLLAEPSWDHTQLMRLFGHKRSFSALRRGLDLERVVEGYRPELDAFEARRDHALLYPVCSGG